MIFICMLYGSDVSFSRYAPPVLLVALAPTSIVVAADYLDVDAAQKAVYPEADAFQQIVISPSAQQLQALLGAAGEQPTHGTIRIWKASRGGLLLGHFFIDEVVGRQDLITYAVGILPDGTLHNLEIMSYRESHGGEVRNPSWRAQFNRRKDLDQLRFRTDIKNISGATLSSEHVTAGVRWLLALWQATLRPAAASD
jgi:FMN-binding domain